MTPRPTPRADETRLDEIRRAAAAPGRVETDPGRVETDPGRVETAGYYGRSALKPAPWTWEVPLYLFVGGLAGGGAVLALAVRVAGVAPGASRAALWIAVAGATASAALLVRDLGRPRRFLNMLRVFKWRSPMSVGVWLLTAFGAAATAALLLEAWVPGEAAWARAAAWSALAAAALLGALVATYTGVLLAATAMPVWHTHAGLLPVHFGAAALGSAAAALELLGHRLEALQLVGLVAAGVETGAWAWTEIRRHGARDRALRDGRSGLLVRSAAVLSGPLSLGLRLAGWRAVAAAAFLAGALLSRFGWLAAGRASALDTEAALG